MRQEENELYSRVGAGTPMGNLIRQYWIPVLLSTELAEPDGKPARVRLLGENLIAFRDTAGRVGLVGNHCPHRGASLFFGRNEEGGLRCVYHGWKFDVSGRCVDLPNEPADSNYKDRIHHVAYPCRERNGVVWTYMGPRKEPPPLPDFEWNMQPDNVPFMWKNFRACNWTQAMEGDLDSSHANFLHTQLDPKQRSYLTVPGKALPGRLDDISLALGDRTPR
ncbi:MAG: aromatic ring-hydroxylating dioxygenase subunit alpha, partial [Gammaproteobacteria bacterium]|nr:aromatic ring-hydroxylating dioxygenase subunit alpha [Gammaproteobacteria bacterium]